MLMIVKGLANETNVDGAKMADYAIDSFGSLRFVDDSVVLLLLPIAAIVMPTTAIVYVVDLVTILRLC